jgi:predicted nucleic acid-binding protein
VKGLTVDSSVIISSLLEQESRHKDALEIWKRVLAGKDFAVMPFSVLVEVVAAIRRRTGSEELALQVKQALLGVEAVSFIVLDEQAAEDAAEIAAKTAVRGMDALVIQVAREFGTELVSFDHEMMAKAAAVLPKAAPR